MARRRSVNTNCSCIPRYLNLSLATHVKQDGPCVHQYHDQLLRGLQYAIAFQLGSGLSSILPNSFQMPSGNGPDWIEHVESPIIVSSACLRRVFSDTPSSKRRLGRDNRANVVAHDVPDILPIEFNMENIADGHTKSAHCAYLPLNYTFYKYTPLSQSMILNLPRLLSVILQVAISYSVFSLASPFHFHGAFRCSM